MIKRSCCLGLGNPGNKYRGTRHNVGFDWIDSVARAHNLTVKSGFESDFYVLEAPGEEIYLLKPQTFMNLSGQALRAWLKKFPKWEKMLVVYDDKDLPTGKLRYRSSGSDGGQRGLRSLIESFGSQNLPRLRIGVGTDEPIEDTADFVLSRFRPEEKQVVEQVLSVAPEHFQFWREASSEEELMNQLNSWRPKA